jgi:hypothetical protein
MTETVAPPEPAPAVRDVIVFLPGLMNPPDQSADVMAQRIARALDRSSPASAQFAVKPATDEAGGQHGETVRRASIVRTDKGGEVPVIDLYSLPYPQALSRGHDAKNSFSRAIDVAAVAFRNFPAVVKARKAKSKTGRQKRQVLYASMLFMSLIAYLVILLGMILNAAWDTGKASWAVIKARPAPTAPATTTTADATSTSAPATTTTAAPAPRQDEPSHPPALWKRVGGAIMQWGELLILLVTAGGVYSGAEIKAAMERIGRETRAAADYLRDYTGSGSLRGRLDHLLDRVQSDPKVPVGRIHVIGYSFGSIVALDSFFPRGNDPGLRVRAVDTLVTIGCPFDFVRTYFPEHFTGRNALANVPPRWINVFDPRDILGSNFHDDDDAQPRATQERGIGPSETARPTDNIVFSTESGSVVSAFMTGFRVHARYFVKDDLVAWDVTEKVVELLYEGSDVIAA